MGVYIAEAQRAKSTLQHSLQCRALASQSHQAPYESVSDSTQPGQMSRHVPEDEPYGIVNQRQPPQTPQTRGHPSEEYPEAGTGPSEQDDSADQCCSPAGVTQQVVSQEAGMAGGSQQWGAGTPQLAFQLPGAAHQGDGTSADTAALQHGYHRQTHAEIRQSPENNQKHESHLQLKDPPMGHVQQALSRVFESCQRRQTEKAHWQSSGEEQEEEEGACEGSHIMAPSPNAAKFAYAR